MDGALSILSAIHVKEVYAIVCWYRLPPEEAADSRTIKVPIQGHFALEDVPFPPAQVDALESKLKEGNVNYEFFRYQAQHAFGKETGPYNQEATKLAWQRTLSTS
ncbi:MAG: dienelactone hydrolase family protein [Desulfatiglandales bacterium]|jgi:carboxymethylenebutenolidase|nr:dienelactone hydrolase family protein [Desulfatiglandales bacterium]